MVNQQIVDYLKRNSGQYGMDAAKKTLIQQGYNAPEVEEAAAAVIGQPAEVPIVGPGTAVPMMTVVQWGAAAGAGAGAITGVIVSLADLLGIGGGQFSMASFIIALVMSAVFGIVAAILIGSYGKKIPVGTTIQQKGMVVMFAITLLITLMFNFGIVFEIVYFVINLVGMAAGAFIFGKLLQQKIPNLM